MINAIDHLSLPDKSPNLVRISRQSGQQNLDGCPFPNYRMAGLINLPHRALAKPTLNLILIQSHAYQVLRSLIHWVTPVDRPFYPKPGFSGRMIQSSTFLRLSSILDAKEDRPRFC